MDAIDGLGRDLTIRIVAHRLSTLGGCDQIVELSGGRVRSVRAGIDGQTMRLTSDSAEAARQALEGKDR